ncbi:hypothetical protein [uncultured Dokdonia sp.]|uniref:hypothetical protein n=1 Tax=uncultured Dokdonia sp. TaxID=575653 RepID=UPI0026107545|nr:hypothetical protein [uncultured Dokdonia sp.]
MCRELETIKFCSCKENLNLSKRKKQNQYIWILERVKEVNTSGMLGLTMLPKDQLDELIPEFIVQELNTTNLFDFEYTPMDNDSLRIERVHRTKSRKKEYLFGEYLNFYYSNGAWHIGQVDPFSYYLEVHKDGKVKIEKVTTH